MQLYFAYSKHNYWLHATVYVFVLQNYVLHVCGCCCEFHCCIAITSSYYNSNSNPLMFSYCCIAFMFIMYFNHNSMLQWCFGPAQPIYVSYAFTIIPTPWLLNICCFIFRTHPPTHRNNKCSINNKKSVSRRRVDKVLSQRKRIPVDPSNGIDTWPLMLWTLSLLNPEVRRRHSQVAHSSWLL